RDVQGQLGEDRVRVSWKFFPLDQVNAPPDAEFPIWDLPSDRRSRGRDSLHAAAAARRQSPAAFDKFHAALLTLKHEEGEDHGRRETLDQAAARAGLDRERFDADLADRSLLLEIRDDYLLARNELGVFGTPTFVFADEQSAYLQLMPPPPPDEAVALWDDFVRLVGRTPSLREIKRPRKPE
ncbi:MAG: DsbA family protein, partial [Chloroflexia bacterium]|nr:DsbA family protein [Chloroflexia bacterium]